MYQKVLFAIIGATCVAGCAKSAEKVTASYVSPLNYQSYNCTQLAQEAERISTRAVTLTGVQNNKATSDAVATTVAVVVFWPAAFLVGGDDAQTAELARLKGEMETMEQVSIQKKCPIAFQREAAPSGAGGS